MKTARSLRRLHVGITREPTVDLCSSTSFFRAIDEPVILLAFQRQFHRRFELQIDRGPDEGLPRSSTAGPFAAIVSDWRMPMMDGIEFLTSVREAAPDMVRVMPTMPSNQCVRLEQGPEAHRKMRAFPVLAFQSALYQFPTLPGPACWTARCIALRRYRSARRVHTTSQTS
jgi:CheY-like chemotaxis protein